MVGNVPASQQTGPTTIIDVSAGGFAFIVQANDIALDGLTFQSTNYAAADGSFGVYNLSPTTVRNVVFTHVQTGLYAGAGIVLSGSRFETSNDAMYSTGNSATISDTTFAPPGAYAGLVSSGAGPVTITGSRFLSGTYGFLTYAGSSPVTVTGTSFAPSIPNALYNDGSPVNASNNWSGCNGGANASGCASLSGPGAGTTTVEPHLVLSASVDHTPIGRGATATVTAAVDHNSAGTPVTTTFFHGAAVGFATDFGTLDHASAPLGSNGGATAQLTAPNSRSTADVSVTLGNATVHTSVVVADVPLTITVDGGVAFARSGSSLAVSGTGNPGSSVQVTINGANAGAPVAVAGDRTWSASGR